jgi:hypothetical protein
MRAFEEIVMHPSCVHSIEEFRLYSYSTDRLSGDVMPDVLDKNNHCIDSIRYGIGPLIKTGGATAFLSSMARERAILGGRAADRHAVHVAARRRPRCRQASALEAQAHGSPRYGHGTAPKIRTRPMRSTRTPTPASAAVPDGRMLLAMHEASRVVVGRTCGYRIRRAKIFEGGDGWFEGRTHFRAGTLMTSTRAFRVSATSRHRRRARSPSQSTAGGTSIRCWTTAGRISPLIFIAPSICILLC